MERANSILAFNVVLAPNKPDWIPVAVNIFTVLFFLAIGFIVVGSFVVIYRGIKTRAALRHARELTPELMQKKVGRELSPAERAAVEMQQQVNQKLERDYREQRKAKVWNVIGEID